MQKCEKRKRLLAGDLRFSHFYRAKPVSENPKGWSAHGRRGEAREREPEGLELARRVAHRRRGEAREREPGGLERANVHDRKE